MVEPGARRDHCLLHTSVVDKNRGRGKRRTRENQEALLAVEGGVGDEVGHKRARGRPTGSKNKPKSSIIMMSNDNPHALRAHVLHVSNGCDVGESLATFARRGKRGISVLSGSGTVSNVTISQPTVPGIIVSLQGRFDILSLSGGFLLPPAPHGVSGLKVNLAGGQGQVVGGCVVGAMIASGPVLIIAASFMDVSYDHLPLDEEESAPTQLETHSSAPAAPPQKINMPRKYNVPTNFVTNCLPLHGDGAYTSGFSARPSPF